MANVLTKLTTDRNMERLPKKMEKFAKKIIQSIIKEIDGLDLNQVKQIELPYTDDYVIRAIGGEPYNVGIVQVQTDITIALFKAYSEQLFDVVISLLNYSAEYEEIWLEAWGEGADNENVDLKVVTKSDL